MYISEEDLKNKKAREIILK